MSACEGKYESFFGPESTIPVKETMGEGQEDPQDNKPVDSPKQTDNARPASPQSDQWSDYDENDDDLREIPVFSHAIQSESTQWPIKMEPDIKSVLHEITAKVDRLANDNATMIIAQAESSRINQELRDEVERLRADNSNRRGKLDSAKRISKAKATKGQRATSVLPTGSAVQRAMQVNTLGGDPSSSDESDDDKKSDKLLPKGKYTPPQNSTSDGNESESSSEGFGDIFDEELDSAHSSDSETTKKRKHAAHKRYRAYLARLKYQQAFLKTTPPFIYNDEVQATLFKK